jgi:hypothetical protein
MKQVINNYQADLKEEEVLELVFSAAGELTIENIREEGQLSKEAACRVWIEIRFDVEFEEFMEILSWIITFVPVQSDETNKDPIHGLGAQVISSVEDVKYMRNFVQVKAKLKEAQNLTM